MGAIILALLVMEGQTIYHSAKYYNNLDNLRQPVVGIVTLAVTAPKLKKKGVVGMIPTSYRKWVEQTGARAVVVPHFADMNVIRELLGQVNGLLFPGGAGDLVHDDGTPKSYIRKIGKIYREALKQNLQSGGNFPLWGICLGFQSIVLAASQYKVKISRPNGLNIRKPLEFIDENYEKSLFHDILSPDVKEYLENKNVNYFNHHYGFKLEDFKRNKYLKRDYNVIATYERHGDKFVAIIQHKKYPIIGTQFHPEKILFEHKRSLNVKLTFKSSLASQEMSRILFKPTLSSMNMFNNQLTLNHFLLENFAAEKTFGVFESVYFFQPGYFAEDKLRYVPKSKVRISA